MKKLITTALLAFLLANANAVKANEIKTDEISKQEEFKAVEVVQDASRIGVPIFYYFYKDHKYKTKAVHFTITDNVIRFTNKHVASHIPVLKNHPNIVAVAIGGGYFLIWDVLIEKQADMPALIADGLAVLVNLKK